ncbi:hypothetical protein CRM22_002430 [Opisthorchis felineus]|uniref:BTB domain-containing protein n=1 Tax=Opisthorchis felineus TaxID=147828 RepID=A0A4S2M646_OPIFE|nr:hypothetical protein CRM22_002430 [Opisthorchis felineus]
MSEENITLVAENSSFTVSRHVLSKYSHYFSAALNSGMSESTSGRFVFPELTAAQLTLFVRSASSGFSVWPGTRTNRQLSHDLSNISPCLIRCELIEILELTTAADYLQTPALTKLCLSRLLDLLTHLFASDSIRLHEQHGCDILRDFLVLWAKYTKEHTNSVSTVLFTFAARNPPRVLDPFLPAVCSPCTQDAVLGLATSLMSSDDLCVVDETQVLQFVLDWIYYLRTHDKASTSVVQRFFDCIRLGLVTHEGLLRLLQFWYEFYPQVKWHDKLSYEEFSALVETNVVSGPFSGILNKASVTPFRSALFRPRAPVPCVISLIQSLKDNSIELWLFDLITGNHYARELPEMVVNQLSNNSVKCGDLFNRIYLCHPCLQKDAPDSSILVLCYDPVNAGCLNGFIWCLATGQAQWIPMLMLHSTGEQRNMSRASGSSIMFRSRRVGVVTLEDGVYVYYASSTQSDVFLHVARLDSSNWTWQEFPPVSLVSDVGNAVVLFTPVEQLSTISSDGWMYCSVEVTSRSGSRIQPVWRHNLHQTSLICSRFFRFRPIYGCKPSDRHLELDLLPGAPFLIRIYHVLPLSALCKEGNDTETRAYLFAFGTCSRDERATQFCLDVTARQWIEWSTCEHELGSSDSFPQPSHTVRAQVQTNLCPKLLGFRGLVCATTLPDLCDVGERNSSPGSPSNTDLVCRSTLSDISSHCNPSMVLIGRPDYRFGEVGQSCSGIWFHRPQLSVGPPEQPLVSLDSSKPAFPLPTSVSHALSHSTSPAAVVHTNWNNLLHSPDMFRFLNSHPSEHKQSTKRLRSSPDIDQSIRLPCFNHPWNWSACDSD